MNAAQHLEYYLGPMDRGRSCDTIAGVQICLFRDQPTTGVNTLATLGLSNAVLEMSQNRKVRQELLFAVRDGISLEESGKLLIHVADTLRTRARAVLRGDVIRPGGRVAASSDADALYASVPVVFPEGLATLEDSVPATVVVWLFPLLPTEVAFGDSRGWSEFEDRLESANPDLFDVSRDSIRLVGAVR